MIRKEFRSRIPGGTTIAAATHRVGDTLCKPWTAGMRMMTKLFDPVIEGRAQQMGHRSTRLQKLARLAFPALALMLVLSAPFAMVGQALKAGANLAKKDFVVIDASQADGTTKKVHNVADDFSIFSWNVAAMPDLIRRINNTRPVDIRMHEAVEYFRGRAEAGNAPGILCFQECFTDQAQDILAEGLKDHYPHMVHSVGKNIVGLNSGLMIMSPYPIVQVRFEAYPNREGENKLSQKGRLGVVLDLGNGNYGVVVTSHLEAGDKWHKRSANEIKDEQVEALDQLAQDLQQHVRDTYQTEPAFTAMTGDFNLPVDMEADHITKGKEVMTHYLNPAARERGEGDFASTLDKSKRIFKAGETLPDHLQKGRMRIDFAELREGSQVDEGSIDTHVVTDTGDTSDHAPVETRFRLAR